MKFRALCLILVATVLSPTYSVTAADTPLLPTAITVDDTVKGILDSYNSGKDLVPVGLPRSFNDAQRSIAVAYFRRRKNPESESIDTLRRRHERAGENGAVYVEIIDRLLQTIPAEKNGACCAVQ